MLTNLTPWWSEVQRLKQVFEMSATTGKKRSESERKAIGRPPESVPGDIAEALLEWLESGETLQDFCRQPGMPKPRTISDWKAKDETFAANFARARDIGEEAILAKIKRIADTPQQGEEQKLDAGGDVIEVKRGDMLGHRKLQIETYFKLLAKWNPKKWGDKLGLEHAGKDGGPLEFVVKVDRDPGA